MIEYAKFIEWIFFGLLSLAGVYLTTTLKDTLKGLKDSIDSLNEKMAVEIEKSNWIRKNIEEMQHEINLHEKKIQEIELKIVKARL